MNQEFQASLGFFYVQACTVSMREVLRPILRVIFSRLQSGRWLPDSEEVIGREIRRVDKWVLAVTCAGVVKCLVLLFHLGSLFPVPPPSLRSPRLHQQFPPSAVPADFRVIRRSFFSSSRKTQVS